MTLRCVECRTRRTTYAAMQDHYAKTGHKLCNCSGLHYAHRPGTKFCNHHPMAGLHHAMRCAELTDEEIQDIALDLIWEFDPSKRKYHNDCPF